VGRSSSSSVRFVGLGRTLWEGGGWGTRLYFVELGRTSASSSSNMARNSDSASSSRVGCLFDECGGASNGDGEEEEGCVAVGGIVD
jgi:hypothetical protein